jgi:hypothetical protein
MDKHKIMITKPPNNIWSKFFLIAACFLVSFALHAEQAKQAEIVPPPLQAWVDWVLHDTQDYTCPPHYNQYNSMNKSAISQQTSGICHWPSRLKLNINATKAEFSQEWQVYSKGWITLPGSAKHWPQQVQINNTVALVADRSGVPSLFVPKGKFRLRGEFEFSRFPEFLQVPANTGIIDLTINGKSVPFPKFDSQGRLWLRQRGVTSEKAEENRLDLRVYRQVIDDIPLQVITRIELDVSGRHREVVLGPVLLDKHIAMFLNSPLPARLEADGSLRLQVRPGSWTLKLHTRQVGVTSKLTLLPSAGKWVQQEVWVFKAHHDLRLVEVTGVTGIDPQQTALPRDWRKFPAYLMRPGDSLQLIEKRRGDPEPAPDKLKLTRNFWLDFDGKGYSVQDYLSGTMTRGWRLEMTKPAILGRVAVNGKNQFITHLEGSNNTGIEVRRGQINVIADSRLEDTLSKLPAIGWAHYFHQVNANLHLPPGWRLLNVTGADSVPNTWIKQWTLLDLFIVLIMAAAIAKLWNWKWGALTLVTLILVYHEPAAPRFIWLNIIAAIALLRVLPSLGWFSSMVRWYRELALISLIIIVLPFMMQQVRQSIYPQLEKPWASLEKGAGYNQATYNKNFRYDKSAQIAAEIATEAQSSIRMYEKNRSNIANLGAFNVISKSRNNYAKLKKKKLLQIDPNAQVQTGPGLPKWEWRNIPIHWSGPVDQNQSIKLWLLSPLANSLVGGIRVILLGLLTVFLLWVSWGPRTRQPKVSATKIKPSQIAATTVLMLGILLSLPLISVAEPVQQQSAFPSQSLLNQLQTRLLKQPDCLPTCASSPRLLIQLNDNLLQARMEIHSLSDVGVPLPGSAKQWLPQQVLLDGEPAKALLRQQNGQLWLNVTKGIHQIQLIGALPQRNTVQLFLPLKPHSVVIDAKGWRVEGLHENGVADQQLQFTREQINNNRLVELEMGNLPPFVQIERTLLLGLDWQVETRIIRKTGHGAAILLKIPLLKGESVTSEKIRVENGNALINMSPNQSEIRWLSVFDKQNTIVLTAPDNTFSNEIWRLDASAIWHVEIKGIPVVHHQNKGRWLPEWRPWSGETVSLELSRPTGVMGQVLTIDRSQLIVSPGQRTTDNQLLLSLRSSRGMQHKIILPEDAKLQSVKINQKSQPLRQDGRIVTLPITPGTQKIDLQFQQPIGIGEYFRTPKIELGINSVNTNIAIKMPSDRWILFTGGKAIGPAVMIWGILIVIVFFSIGLGRVSITPLKTHHWLLLGVVLSQVPVPLMLFIIGWFMALGWREQLSTNNLSPLKFDAIQISLGILTIIALSGLLFAIKLGLLGHPNMHIAGNASSSSYLRWYEDRTAGILPQVWIFSLSMWIYRIAMLLWALWLSFALLRWLRWGWESFSKDRLWKTLWTKKGKTVQSDSKFYEEAPPTKNGK